LPRTVVSWLWGVIHPASATVLRLLSLFPASLLPFLAGVPAIGVGQPASVATWFRLTVAFVPSARLPVAVASFAICEPSAFPFVGVGQPIQSLSEVRRAEPRSAGIGRPDGVSLVFQVSRYKVEPFEAASVRNLFAKHWDSAMLAVREEVQEGGPEVPLVSKPASLASRAERLAGEAGGPDRPVVVPPASPESEAPGPDAGEEMALREPSNVMRRDLFDSTVIDHAVRDLSRFDQLPQPRGGGGIVLVVVCAHPHSAHSSASAEGRWPTFTRTGGGPTAATAPASPSIQAITASGTG